MFKSLSLIFVAFFVQGAISQALLDGQCPEVTPLKNWSFEGFMGRHFGLQRYPLTTAIINNTRCLFGDYSLVSEDYAVAATKGINIDTGAINTEDFPMRNFGNGALAFGNDNQSLAEPNTYVLDTDYKNFAVVYGCANANENQYQVTAWLIGRERTLEESYVARAYKAFESVNFDTTLLIDYDQTNCPADF